MKINDVDIRNHGFRVQQIHNNPLLPSFDHITSGTIAGRAGELYSRTQIKPKFVSFELHVDGDVEVKAEQFKRYFLNEYGEFVETKVQFDYSDNYIMARINGQLGIQRHPNHGIISVDLVQLDPFGYGEEITVSGSVSPLSITGPTGMSDTKGLLTFTFSASTGDFILTHVGQNKVIRLIHSFTIGDVLTIDLETELVEKNGSRIMVDLDLSSRFFPIRSGANSISFNTSGTLQISIDPKFI